MLNPSMTQERVAVRRKVRLSTGKGGFRQDFIEVGSEMVHVKPVAARPDMAMDRPQASATHVVYGRASAGLKRGDVLVRAQPFDPRFLEVLSVRALGGTLGHLEADALLREKAPK